MRAYLLIERGIIVVCLIGNNGFTTRVLLSICCPKVGTVGIDYRERGRTEPAVRDRHFYQYALVVACRSLCPCARTWVSHYPSGVEKVSFSPIIIIVDPSISKALVSIRDYGSYLSLFPS